jgi:hypothetical protein
MNSILALCLHQNLTVRFTDSVIYFNVHGNEFIAVIYLFLRPLQ